MGIINDRTVKTRKHHPCELCGYTIKKGSQCRSYNVTDGDDIYSIHEHLKCTEIASQKWEDDDWRSFGELEETLREDYPDYLEELKKEEERLEHEQKGI